MQNEFLRLQNMLHKTIVFITHDFDEAIRLADRIAIMFEGEIVQVGTAEELITNPATDYVAEFTRDIPRAKLLSVASLMQPTKKKKAGKLSVNASDRIASVASAVLMQPDDVTVLDDAGKICGELSRDQVAAILFDTETTSAGA
jgi:glycine betaine/proline transport system ATP-binding protein